jgi:hypothetical protein
MIKSIPLCNNDTMEIQTFRGEMFIGNEKKADADAVTGELASLRRFCQTLENRINQQARDHQDLLDDHQNLLDDYQTHLHEHASDGQNVVDRISLLENNSSALRGLPKYTTWNTVTPAAYSRR